MGTTNNHKGMVLVIDDEIRIGEAIKKALERCGYQVETVINGTLALERLKEASFEVVICDLKLPDMDGIQLLREIKENELDTAVIMITGYASVESAVSSMKLGAQEYICKPFKPEQIRAAVSKVLAQKNILDDRLQELYGHQIVIGKNSQMRNVFRLAQKVANNNANVLITGESGTGKEVVARTIHLFSPRAGRPFVTVNCAAIPEPLLESELFGHRKGAFTGATYTRKGSFELAHGGTIFLDEIGEMRVDMQAKILRVLDERKIKSVGAEEAFDIDVRVIAATNKNLEEEIRKGNFREDLFYRLNVIHIAIPPLREHKEDIPIFVNHFLQYYQEEMKKKTNGLSEEVMDLLMAYDWPGNIRELKNAIERAAILVENNSVIRKSHFPHQIQLLSSSTRKMSKEDDNADLKVIPPLKEIEIKYIKKVLAMCNGNKTKAAKLLGITPVTIWRKLGASLTTDK
jgi:DNA-binding NtrC family response regulator